MRRFTLILYLFLTNIFIFAQTLSIDFQLDTNANGKTKNHLNWTLKSTTNTSTTVTTTKDYFDAVSSASKKHSTKELREVYIDSKSKKQAMPKGLYTLLLFAVSSPDFFQKNDFKITSQEKKLTIQFIHRGIAYKISTNEKGYFDLSERTDAENGFFIAKDIATGEKGVFSLKEDFLLEGTDKTQMQNADWEKFTFTNDTFDNDIDLAFAGKLKTSYKNGILKIKGKLTKKVPVKPEPEKETKTEDEPDKIAEDSPESQAEEPSDEKMVDKPEIESEIETQNEPETATDSEENEAETRKKNRWKFN